MRNQLCRLYYACTVMYIKWCQGVMYAVRVTRKDARCAVNCHDCAARVARVHVIRCIVEEGGCMMDCACRNGHDA